MIFVGCQSAGNVELLSNSNIVERNQSVSNTAPTFLPTIKTVKKASPTPTVKIEFKTDEIGGVTGLQYIDKPKLGEHYKPVWMDDKRSDNGFEPFCVQTKIKGEKIEKCGYQDAEGKVLIKPIFDTVFVFSEGLAGVCPKSSQLCGYLNEKGILVIKANYQFVDVFSEGLAGVGIVAVDYGKWGYINKNGKVIVKLHYTDGEPFRNGIAKVKLVGLDYCINKEDEEVKCPE